MIAHAGEGAISGEGRRAALQPIPVGWLLAGAAALALLTASRVYLSLDIKGMAEPAHQILSGEALRFALWLPTAPLIAAVEGRWGLVNGIRPLAIGLHAAVALIVVLAHTLVMTVVGVWAGWYFAMDTVRGTFLVQLVHESVAIVLLYAALVGAMHARRHLHERQERRLIQSSLEARLARERLRNLQMQLHPHFIFNTLHAVGGLLRDGDRKTAVDTVADLGDLLRRSLQQSDRQLITLREEIDFIRAYLKIQKARYADLLDVHVDVPPALEQLLVPNLMLQPLVENAIRHGTSRAASGGSILVRASRHGERLRVEVSDDGPGPASADPAEGIGLRNSRQRLVEMYGREFILRLEPRPGGGTTAVMEIPLRTSGDPAGA